MAALGALAASAWGQSDSSAVTIAGNPLTVDIGPRGECQSSYTIGGEVAGNFYLGSNPVGDCGFFLAFPTAGAGQPPALQKKTFGFEGLAGPGAIAGVGVTPYTPLVQTPVSGAGTEASPYTQTTTFEVKEGITKFALVTETTTYVNGAPQFTSTYNVKNESGGKLYFRAIYAGDLYVNGNDHGTGVFLGGPPRFIGGQNTGSGVLGGFVEAPPPALPWSAFQEAYWSNPAGFEGISPTDNGIWNDVETRVNEEFTFNNSIEPMELDNGAGVEWDQLRTAGLASGAEQAFTIINRTTIPSGLQINPVNQTLTQGQTATIAVKAVDTGGGAIGGKTLRYTISGGNPQSGAIPLNGSGEAQIGYVGGNAGIDTVQMYVDLSGSGTQTSNDPSGAATVTWLPKPPPPPPGPPAPNSTYKVLSIHANSNGTITIVFVPTQSGQATLEVTVPTGTIARKQAEAAKHKKCKKGLVRIKGKCLKPTTLSGKLTATGVAGVKLIMTVKPSSKVKAALKKGRTVTLTAKLTYRSALGGNPTTSTYVFKVKAPKKHKKH